LPQETYEVPPERTDGEGGRKVVEWIPTQLGNGEHVMPKVADVCERRGILELAKHRVAT
jgi:hypothetical protein